MLVLSRKLGQRFQIGHDIKVTILRIDRNCVRIGVEAPDGRMIYREEILPAESAGPGQSPDRVPLCQPA
jgi:carbon storage regulator